MVLASIRRALCSSATLFFASVSFCVVARAQVSPPEPELLDQEAQAAVATRIGELLQERYVFPEVATDCAAHLADLVENGSFASANEPESFAAALTEALRSVAKDQHLLVRVRAAVDVEVPPARPHPARAGAERHERDRVQNFGFKKIESLEGNVGYLDLRSFAHPRGAFNTAVAAMAMLAESDAIIFDLRKNSGGSPGMVQFLCSHLFDEPTHLNSLYFREGDRTQEFWTHGVPGKAMPDVPVFVMTSADTFSAAEEFSYNLRTQKRATLVGETTRGGANPGGLFLIDGQFDIVIPTGRAINPITGTNWEDVGVIPHVPVPAGLVMQITLDLARAAAEERRALKESRWDALGTSYRKAIELAEAGDAVKAAATMEASLQQGRDWDLLSEADINTLGYDLVGLERRTLAVLTFTFNTRTYPESANAHDSLGEALRGVGFLKESIDSYERALALDPEGIRAAETRATIDEIRQERAKKRQGN